VVRDRVGFSLIDFSIILCLVGLLAAILIPNIADMYDQAREADANANARFVQRVAETFLSRTNRYPLLNELQEFHSADSTQTYAQGEGLWPRNPFSGRETMLLPADRSGKPLIATPTNHEERVAYQSTLRGNLGYFTVMGGEAYLIFVYGRDGRIITTIQSCREIEGAHEIAP
jgi:competence protein ComGC